MTRSTVKTGQVWTSLNGVSFRILGPTEDGRWDAERTDGKPSRRPIQEKYLRRFYRLKEAA